MGKAGIILTIVSVLFSFLFFFHDVSYSARTPRCTDVNPGSAPSITGVTTVGSSVTLNWSQALEPVTHYTLAYGPAKDQLIYGAPDIGSQGTGTFTVEQLSPGQRYYFRIRAVNNCEPGDFSDTVSVVVGVNKEGNKIEIPRLSFLRQDKTASPAVSVRHANKEKGMVVLGATVGECTNGCISLPILITEIIVLLSYFFLASKYSFFRPIFSPLIPLGFYFLFLFVNRNCNTYFFFCDYFGMLSLISFILILLLQKQHLFRKLLDPHLVTSKKEK